MRHLQAKALVCIERKRTTIEDQLVLSTHLVGIENRQFSFDNLLQHNLITALDLGAMIRRAIRHQQEFCTTFGQRFRHTQITPDILADRNTDAYTAEVHRSGHWTGLENALFIKLAVVRQVDLEPFGNDFATVENGD
ncbi:hypothetical protein D9M70_550280 [compost metagenome]